MDKKVLLKKVEAVLDMLEDGGKRKSRAITPVTGISNKPAEEKDRWLTLHPHGPGSKGLKIKITPSGVIKAGVGGTMNGKQITSAGIA